MNRGFSLVAILVFGASALLVVSTLIGAANASLSLGRRALASEQALRTAEAGVETYLRLLNDGLMPSGETVQSNLTDRDGAVVGTYEIVQTITQDGVGIVSTAASAGAVRRVGAEFIRGEGVSFNYGIQSGNGGFVLGNGAVIDGNVYSNADIEGGNGSAITGDAYAAGEVEGVDVEGETHEGSLPVPLPISTEDINRWKSDAEANATTSKTLFGPNNSLGPMKINGNLVLSGDAALTVTGTLWVTGDITLGNGAAIRLSPLYGNIGGIVIADGEVDLGNNSVLEGTGEDGSTLLLISTADSESAMSMGNNTGAVSLYAPNGRVSLGNNADLKVIAAETVDLGNNVVLSYEEGLINLNFTSGPSGSWTRTSWKEI